VNNSVTNFIHGQRYWRLAAMAVVVLLVAGTAGVFATKTPWSTPTQQGANMKLGFVLIFRQGHKTLSEDEQKRRTEEVRAWALQQIKDGRGSNLASWATKAFAWEILPERRVTGP
jgi:hypothetical protein